MASRILVVEDEREIRSLIVEELEDEGYEVETAENGQDGLDKIESFKPNLIISDITMPIMNGHEFLTEFRSKFSQMRSVPFIFLSALADRRHVIEGKKLGVDDYITKPIDFEMLLVTIETRLREVLRMTEEKEEQMVQLYSRIMASNKKPQTKNPVLVVTNQWANMSGVQAALKKLDLPFLIQYRGSHLDQYLEQKKYTTVILTDVTDDISAKLAMHKSKMIRDYKAQKILLLEKSAQKVDKTYWSSFDQVFDLHKAAEELEALL